MKIVIVLIVGLFIIGSSCNTIVEKDQLNLQAKLKGKWMTLAFEGELHEEWHLMKDGWMQQKGYYIENNDTLYSATTKIEKVGDEIILFSVIKNSNPKIFKAIKVKNETIVFENKDYKNPYQVKYEFLDKNNYRRTITGVEKDSLVSYSFNFKKLK